MARLRVKANELKDVAVNYVSLVKRGANRIPFRIVKSDEGDTAVLDMASFWIKKADTEEAARQSVRKFEDLVKAAMDLLIKAGYEVKQKSDPADDGSGDSNTKNPGEQPDAGGQRNDSTSANFKTTKNPTDGADAGGPRNDSTELPTGREAAQLGKTGVEKGDVKNPADEIDGTDANQADADGSDNAEVKKSGKFPPKAKAAPVAAAAPAPAEGSPAEEATETPEEEAAEQAALQKKAKAKKTEDATMLAAIKGMFADHSAELVAFVKSELDGVKTAVTAIEARVQKSEEASSAVGKRIAALVPGQSAPDPEAHFQKSDTDIPPLDTGYTRFAE